MRRANRDISDPAKNRLAIILGIVIIGITFCCCLVTVLGWVHGALNLLA